METEAVRNLLFERRQQLYGAIASTSEYPGLKHLLDEVDAALARIARGSYGLCETCHDPIEIDRLAVDPLIRFCIDHLTAREQRLLERDLDAAYLIQKTLLPKRPTSQNWDTALHYEPAGPVGGDYCDLLLPEGDGGPLFFVLGDVTGKGVAASLLMSNLHAIFHSLLNVGLPLEQVVAQANRIFCEGTLTNYFATLICGRAEPDGRIQLINAGHCYPLLISAGVVRAIESGTIPFGLFCSMEYTADTVALNPGDTLVLYSDGVTEWTSNEGDLYGEERLVKSVTSHWSLAPQPMLEACLEDVKHFGKLRQSDDLSLMIIRRR